jgi:hypothetical protein
MPRKTTMSPPRRQPVRALARGAAPFVETVGRQQAATLAQGLAKHRLFGNGFGAGMGRGARQIGQPGRRQAPTGTGQLRWPSHRHAASTPNHWGNVPLRLLIGGKTGQGRKGGFQRNRA